jgi:hypothetical protein
MRTTPLDTATRFLLATGLFGALTFVAVFLVDGATRTGYRAARHPVSALALGDRGWVQSANFVLTGLSMAAFSLGLRRALEGGPTANWASALVLAFGIGLVASGVFAMDPLPDYPPGSGATGDEPLSWHAIAHDVAGLVVFTALPAAALVLAGRFLTSSGLRWLGGASCAAGLLCAGLFVAFAAAYEAASGSAGLIQRASIVVGWGWIALVAAVLLALPPGGAR